MREYPPDRVRRQALRQQLVEDAVERARVEARLACLSINCEQDMRFGVELEQHRCRSNGNGCLCACHDRDGEGEDG